LSAQEERQSGPGVARRRSKSRFTTAATIGQERQTRDRPAAEEQPATQSEAALTDRSPLGDRLWQASWSEIDHFFMKKGGLALELQTITLQCKWLSLTDVIDEQTSSKVVRSAAER
jgi:hypothetical protein